MQDIIASGDWLPYTFVFLMGLSMLLYALLDGYDLGVGLLTHFVPVEEKDVMIASIGPFWDANETWLILGIGILLIAFPQANGIILGNLYLPVLFMIIGLILRGVSFDFRTKVDAAYRHRWDRAFVGGSALAAASQGYMLGSYIIGFDHSLKGILFSAFIGLCLLAGYALIGASWLIIKTEGDLQRKAVRWARIALWLTVAGIAAVSLTTPFVSQRIFDKWFSFPNILLLAPIPVITGALVIALEVMLRQLPKPNDRWCWVPFLMTAGIYILCFHGLAYSFFPYIVPDRLLITEAASAPESLMFILVGALIVIPLLLGYTFFAYRVFWGKVNKALSYQ